MSIPSYNLGNMPLCRGHYWVLFVSSLGQMIGACLSTVISVMLPLMQIHLHPQLTSLEQGLICCSSLIGITIGSLLFGKLGDLHGYLFYFRLCPLLVLAGSLLICFIDTKWIMVIGLFIMGLGIGGEYSLDSDYISEIMPHKWKIFMVGVAKALSSIGSILAAALCFFVLKLEHNAYIWNKLILIIAALALLMFVLRLNFAQSPKWLIVHNRVDEAKVAARYFFKKNVELDSLIDKYSKEEVQVSWSELFKGANLPKVILSGVPWACSGFAAYGIGIFLPILIMALGLESSTLLPIDKIIDSVKNTTYISMFILVGFMVGLYYINRISHIKLQGWGFILSAISLAFLLVAYCLHFPLLLALVGFMLFEFFMNAGPNLITFIIPTEVFDVAERGVGAGLAASWGKVGAVVGVLFMPLLLDWGGVTLVLLITVFIMILGGIITFVAGGIVEKAYRKQVEANKH